MFRKSVILAGSVLLVLVAIVGFLFYRSDHTSRPIDSPPDVVSESRVLPSPPTRLSTKAKLGEDRTLLHPLADPEKRAAYAAQPPPNWEEWAKALTEIRLGRSVEEGYLSTLEEVASERSGNYSYLLKQAKHYEKINHPIPTPVTEMPHLDEPVYYEGPQTTEAIMLEFDDKYDNSFPRAAEMELSYPRAAFLQRALAKGAVVKDVSDYKYYMKLRGELLYRKDRPDDWRSGNYGIPITTDFSEYEDGFLDRKVWENSITQQVSEVNPDRSVTVYFPSHHPDKYIPVIGKMRYVRFGENRSGMSSFGVDLTQEQAYNLQHKGIEPEGVEIVYIDEDYNLLPEPPPLANNAPREHVHHHVKFDGIDLTPENYVSVVGNSPSLEWLEDYEARQADDMHATVPDTDLEAMRAAAREAAEAAESAAKSEFEKFQQGMRQLEEFASMSDAEIEKTLENQFRQKFLPQHPLEQLEHFTPERLENALGTLFQHGFDDGFRRISRDSPALAEQLKQYFGQGQKPPAGKLPKGSVPPASPAPPEAAPQGTDTD